MANAFVHLEEEAKALDIYVDLLLHNPNDRTALEQYATLLTRCGRSVEAYEVVGRLAVLIPSQAPWVRKIAKLYHLAGALVEAEAACRKSIELEPTNPKFHFDLALILADKGEFAGAAEEAQRAATDDPKEDLYRDTAEKYKQMARS